MSDYFGEATPHVYRIGGKVLTAYAMRRIRNYLDKKTTARSRSVQSRRSSLSTFRTEGEMSSLTGLGQTSGAGSMATVYTGTRAANRQSVRARQQLRGTRASSTRPTAMKAAMYLPGRGAEVDLIHNNYLQPISHVIPWKHAKLRYDGVTSCLENPRGNRLSMDFALKMIIECQDKGLTSNADPVNFPNGLIPTRFHCAHIFRHTNQSAMCSGAGPTATNTAAWNNTLGPDASYVRLTPAEGGSRITPYPIGMANSLLSPYRMPATGSNMYSRISLQTLENLGWNMNPLKFTGFLAPTSSVGGGFAGVSVYQNSPLEVPGVAVTSATSMPGNQMVTATLPGVSNNKFMTQHGPGGVNYTFSNDGTNAVTLECVVIAFKDSANVPTANDGGIQDPYGTFIASAQEAFIHRQVAKQGAQRLAGTFHDEVPATGPTSAGAIFSNAETEFIPSNIFPYIGRNVSGTGSTSTTTNPFKLISRDQFIVGGGQSRLWKTSFPSEVYDASVDSPAETQNINSHTIMVIWGLCSAPLPVLETSTTLSTGKIMLSREPQNCNVSVVGTYHETPTPVFCKTQPAPVNVKGSLSQVSVLPTTATAFPVGSFPLAVSTPVVDSTGKFNYVDLPRSGQQPFTTTATDNIQIGTLSTLG